MPTFSSFAEDLLVQARRLDEQLTLSGKEPTSFSHDSMTNLNAEAERLRDKFIDTLQDVKRLAQGTRGTFDEILYSCTDETALSAIYRYNLAACVPLSGSASFADISKASGLSDDLVERLLRQAMSNHIFDESPPGQVVHTACSRAIIEDPGLYDAIGMMLEDCGPCCRLMLDAFDKWGVSMKPGETAWSLLAGSSRGMYHDLMLQPEKGRRLGSAVRYFGKTWGWDLTYLTKSFDWQGADREGVTFVDIGGGLGAVCQALASSTTKVKFVVQDTPATCQAGFKALPEELTSRVSFEPHDFFTEQPIRGADIYFFRWVMHNWSDEYCVKILRALVPALKPGARVINYEFVVKDGPEYSWTNRRPRNMDMLMQAQFNASERTERAWRNLFKQADPRFQLKSITTPGSSMMSIIEAVWDDFLHDQPSSYSGSENPHSTYRPLSRL